MGRTRTRMDIEIYNSFSNYVSQVDVMDTVKRVQFLPGFNGMTTDMAATYFETFPRCITNALRAKWDDFEADGAYYVSGTTLYDSALKQGLIIEETKKRFIIAVNGRTYETGLTHQYMIPKKSILRLAFLLNKSPIADSIKREIVDGYEDRNDNTAAMMVRKELRDRFIGREDALDAVKPIRILPGLNAVTLSMAADYFDLNIEQMFKAYYTHYKELTYYGACERNTDFIRNVFLSCGLTVIDSIDDKVSVCIDGNTYNFDGDRIVLFPKSALLRLSMLLPNNVIARKVRKYLLYGDSSSGIAGLNGNTDVSAEKETKKESKTAANTVPEAPNDIVKTETAEAVMISNTADATLGENVDLSNEELCLNIGRAYMTGDTQALVDACKKVIDLREEEIVKLEEENKKLRKIAEQAQLLFIQLQSIQNCNN
ncbi:MAG: hypothetical protein Q4G33_12470 [bacterium]|nr:hypothetical protein [bacterium]